MIQGKKKAELTREGILKLISSFDIYKQFFGDFKLNVICCNHLRGDRSPSFLIGTKYGEISHYDFGSSDKWSGDCFDLVQQIHSCDFDTALKIIDRSFGLNISCKGNLEYKKIVSEYKQPEELGKRYSLIQCITRPFTKEELEYWNGYHQSIQDLRDNNIYSLKTVYLNRQLFTLKNTELRFGYLYDSHWKIYRPFNEKKSKWVPNNVPSTAMDGKECIKDCDIAMVGKSKKDHMMVKKIFPCSCAVQNESIGCFSKENVEYIKENSKRQILSFDSDVPGVASSQQITKQFEFDYLNVPRKYLSEGINDWAALGFKHGLNCIEKIFKEKNLI